VSGIVPTTKSVTPSPSMSPSVDVVTFCTVEFVAKANGKYGDTENGKMKIELTNRMIIPRLMIF